VRRRRSESSPTPARNKPSSHPDHSNGRFAILQSLFAHYILGLFVGPQSEEDRLTELIVARPLRELDLGDQYRFDPMATLHNGGRDALAPSASLFLRQIYKRASCAFELLQAGVEIRQNLFGKPSSDSPGKEQPLRAAWAKKASVVLCSKFGDEMM
jgi:hypothetical protein